jgi:hypothetical protein
MAAAGSSDQNAANRRTSLAKADLWRRRCDGLVSPHLESLFYMHSAPRYFVADDRAAASTCAIHGTPRIENGGTFAVDFADGRRDRHTIDVRPDVPKRFGVQHRLFRGLYVRDPQCGVPKSKRRLKTTPVFG